MQGPWTRTSKLFERGWPSKVVMDGPKGARMQGSPWKGGLSLSSVSTVCLRRLSLSICAKERLCFEQREIHPALEMWQSGSTRRWRQGRWHRKGSPIFSTRNASRS
eukprot:7519080-Pyramimonas_sp.AAC.1